MDMTLVTSFESAGASQLDRGGTTPALAVRAGLALGQRWGAEVEVAHAFTIERSDTTNGGVLAGRARAPEHSADAGGWFSASTPFRQFDSHRRC